METWVYIVVLIASMALSIALTPKARSKPAALEDIDIPQFEDGSPQEVVFGDVWTESWMVLAYGNFASSRIKQKGLLGSTTIGWRYYMGLHMGLARGPLDAVVEIRIGDKPAWSGNLTDNTIFMIDQPDLFGGEKREGGVSGQCQIAFGAPDQGGLAGAISLYAEPIPGFRGATTFFFDGYIMANSPYPKQWAFRVRRALQGWYGGTAWYPEKAVVPLEAGAIYAMNPAHIIYECMTNPQWGRGLPTTEFDDAAWRAAADTFHTEGFGLCLRWTRQDSIRNFLQAVLDHCGAALYQDRVSGLYVLKPIRGDYDANALPLFSKDTGLLSVEDDDNGSQSVAPNEIIVEYRRPGDREVRQVRAQNLGALQSHGKITKKDEYPGLSTFTLAARVAQRDLRAASGFIKKFRLRMDRRAYQSLTPAAVFRFTDESRDIVNMVVRVGDVEETERDGAITVTVIQDLFSLDSTVYVSEGGSAHVPADTLVPPDEVIPTSVSVTSNTVTDPPAAPADGVAYLVPAGATGAWAGHVGEVAMWNADNNAWDFYTPSAGTLIYVQSSSTYVSTNGSGGVAPAPWQSPTTTEGDLIVRGAAADGRLGVGAEGTVLTIVSGLPAWAVAAAGGGGGSEASSGVLHVRDEKSSGTAGGASVAATWNIRTLNTVKLNTITGASLASNQITLPAGTFDVYAAAPAHQTEGHQLALYNVTDSAYTLVGTTQRSRATSATDGTSVSVVVGRITISSPKVFELRHYTVDAQASGLGAASSSGQSEVFAEAFVRKVVTLVGASPVVALGGRVACVEYSQASPTPLNGLLGSRTAASTTEVAAAGGSANLVDYIPRVRDLASGASGASTQIRFTQHASRMLRAATVASAAAGGVARFTFSPRALNSDSRVFWGLCADAIAGVLAGATEPSARTNLVGLGCDSSDANWQWITNDGSGVATKVDIGVAKGALVGAVLTLTIELTGTDVSLTLENKSTGDEYLTTLNTNLPAIDTYLAMTGFTGNGATTVASGHELIYFMQQHAM